MAHVVSFSVSGLAGRDDVVEQVLDRNINVFFGLNGSGKTSLLKIIHSALSGDTDILRRAAFDDATVVIYSEDADREFVHRIKRSEILEGSDSDDLSWEKVVFLEESSGRVRRFNRPTPWKIKPKPPSNFSGWAHRYLPTWRLYTPPGGDQLARGSRSGDWDSYFASTLQKLWGQYMTGLLSEVRRIQADGLANVLSGILKGSKSTGGRGADSVEMQTKREVYDRVSAFLRRQGTSLGSFASFAKRYQEDDRLQQVVNDINDVELRIEAALRPQTALENLITEMFSGKKRVSLEEDSINVETVDNVDLSLASLSAGEKQALRILIETLFARGNCLLIDEPEISLHIDWQHDLLASMRSLNSDAQLIVATHSPEIMAEIPDSHIFRL